MAIANFGQLATTPERQLLLELAQAGITAVHPARRLREAIQRVGEVIVVNGQVFSIVGKRIFVIGAGKAAAAMAEALEAIIEPERITAGVVISNHVGPQPRKIEVHYADHPIPSERAIEGALKILKFKTDFNIDENDIIIALISGGASSLMALPEEGIDFSEKQALIRDLLRSGASVDETTVVKKKISKVKGGKLARYFYPTPIISLVISDVIGNDLSVIGSGPLALDATTYNDAWRIIQRYNLEESLGPSIRRFFAQTPKQSNTITSLNHVYHALVCDNATAIEHIAEKARQHVTDVIVRTGIAGEAGTVAKQLCETVLADGQGEPKLFVWGGETTVTLPPHHGLGGRNQEIALAGLVFFENSPPNRPWCLASVATDGRDFIAESMGGIVDAGTLAVARCLGLRPKDFLDRHDSHTFLRLTNGNIQPQGMTGTNVCDILLAMLY